MGLKDINTKKKPLVLVDKSLDFFNDKVLFPKKLEKANEMLKKIGLPKLENKAPEPTRGHKSLRVKWLFEPQFTIKDCCILIVK